MVVAPVGRAAGTAAVKAPPWHVTGSYFEACNCLAICPCRRRGGQKSISHSTSGICDFALSWQVLQGAFGQLPLDGLGVIMAGSYRDDEDGRPWRVCLYIDERATSEQHTALAGIFSGRVWDGDEFAPSGGDTWTGFTAPDEAGRDCPGTAANTKK